MSGRTATQPRSMTCVALKRGEDHYVFQYERGNESELLAALMDCAENDDVTFTWLDVLLIMRRLKV